jgi:hypothetical protein
MFVVMSVLGCTESIFKLTTSKYCSPSTTMNNTMDSEKVIQPNEQPLELQDTKPQIQLSKPRFILVLTGLVLSIFLVRLPFPPPPHPPPFTNTKIFRLL